MAELTLRYFTSHGPATPKDFKDWSSLTMADVKKGLDVAATHLASEVIDGLTFYFAEPIPTGSMDSPLVHLIQGYDEYIMGYRESRWLLDIDGRTRPLADRSAPTGLVVLDTQGAGHWKRVPSKDSVIVEAHLFAPPSSEVTRALSAAADSYGEFLGLPAFVETFLI